MGSVRDARHAGTKAAHPETNKTRTRTPANAAASRLDTPNSIPDSNRPPAAAKTSPHAEPTNATLTPCSR